MLSFLGLHFAPMPRAPSHVVEALEAFTSRQATSNQAAQPCPECGLTFPSLELLQNHMASHPMSTWCMCTDCGANLRDKTELKTHQQLVHDFVAYCEPCQKGFKSEKGHEFHLKMHSGNESLPRCELCMRCFQSRAHLKRHLRSHSAVKSCVCPDCGRCYKHNFDLTRHMRVCKHGPTINLDGPLWGIHPATKEWCSADMFWNEMMFIEWIGQSL